MRFARGHHTHRGSGCVALGMAVVPLPHLDRTFPRGGILPKRFLVVEAPCSGPSNAVCRGWGGVGQGATQGTGSQATHGP